MHIPGLLPIIRPFCIVMRRAYLKAQLKLLAFFVRMTLTHFHGVSISGI